MQTEMQTEIEIPEDQLTAYAMGEIAGVDREVVEAFLESDADACQQVQQIRATARLLAGELARETRSALLPVHRVTIEQHVYPLPPLPDLPPARSKRFWRIVTWALGLAAGVALVA